MLKIINRIKNYLFYLSILSVIIFSPCCSDDKIVNNSSKNDEIYANMDIIIKKCITDYKIPGMVVYIVAPDKEFSYVKAFGFADKNSGSILKTSDIFRIGSITKTFTVTALLQLVDEGKIQLDDKLNKYLPDYPNAKNVTISQLCNMTSGIYNYAETTEFANTIISNPNGYLAPDDLINFTTSYSYYFTPGTDYYYSNTNTIIIGKIIEILTGDSLENQINKRFLVKYGLINTNFPTDKYLLGEHAHGYGSFIPGTGDMDVTDLYDVSWAWAAGAMTSNVYDLAVWVKYLATGILVLPETQLKRLEYVTLSQQYELKYGLGLMSAAGFIGHNGMLPGFQAIAVYSPQKNATFIILMNMFFSDGTGIDPTSIFMILSNLVYDDLPWNSLSSKKITNNSHFKKYIRN
ncbi:MAG: serine hydrolase domain-containing protein [bacterium]